MKKYSVTWKDEEGVTNNTVSTWQDIEAYTKAWGSDEIQSIILIEE